MTSVVGGRRLDDWATEAQMRQGAVIQSTFLLQIGTQICVKNISQVPGKR